MTVFERLASFVRRTVFVLEKLCFGLLCPVCGESMKSWRDDPLCTICRERIAGMEVGSGCLHCGNWIIPPQKICLSCVVSPPPIEGFWTCGPYDGEMKALIKAYKYGQVVRLAPFLAGLMRDQLAGRMKGWRCDGVVIVPRHGSKPGLFYPMKRLARLFCRLSGLPLISGAVVKIRETPPQASLKGRSRRRNLRGAFRCRRNRRVSGQNLLLIDDVCTTGTTIRQVAEVLNRAGARVWVLVVAKAQ
jgi:predicted amidophosphoribosyltransferase